MDTLHLDRSEITPEVDLDPSGNLSLEGKSIPDNPLEFYMPLLEWVDEYIKGPPGETKVKVYLEYINSSSAKYLLELLKRLEGVNGVTVDWMYDEGDENMMEEGNDYKALINVPFNFIEVEY